MKIRTGFVSNSSSSSYILFGRRISLKDVLNKSFKYPVYMCGHEEWGEGEDVFELTDDMINYLKDNPTWERGFRGHRFEFFETVKIESTERGRFCKFDPEEIKDAEEILSTKISYHHTSCLINFIENYGNKKG